ncbi:MAG: hypothetical protein KBS83_06475 [Lachnospiraceae bacterium]|nr:hypothetical protein [Candidatus Equihabitans merdae]
MLAVVLSLSILCQSVSAYNVDLYEHIIRTRERSQVQDDTNPASWRQGIVPENWRGLKAGESEDTILNGGCSYFAVAYMLLKMGLLDLEHGETPITVIDKMEAVKGWLTWGKMDYTRINEAYPTVTCHAYKAHFKSNDFHQQLDEMRELMKQGYFIIVCLNGDYSNGHYIFVDEITDDDDMIIGDSSYEGTTWSDLHGPWGGYLIDYSLFTCPGADPLTNPSIYDWNIWDKDYVGHMMKDGLPNKAGRENYEKQKAEEAARRAAEEAAAGNNATGNAAPGSSSMVGAGSGNASANTTAGDDKHAVTKDLQQAQEAMNREQRPIDDTYWELPCTEPNVLQIRPEVQPVG